MAETVNADSQKTRKKEKPAHRKQTDPERCCSKESGQTERAQKIEEAKCVCVQKAERKK